MSESWNNVKTVCCKPWLVLPTVYSDALSYGEQLDKFCYSLNKVIENNNILPEYVAEKIKEYISSGAIGEVVREILANYILNVKYPPKGIAPAVGDGSADDTEALQGCIDYAAENGGVVYFPYGSYLTQPLTMKNGVSLFGFDRYSTKIVLKGGATKALLNGNGNNLSVCNLTLDGNSGIQVSDVNVVDMTGSNLMFNDLVIKDGYKLFNFIGDGHLQLSNIVFGNAVENCFTVDGNVIVQTNNLLFTALSKVGGISVVDIRANGGNYDFNSVAKCDTCMLISGNDNKVVALIGGANEDYVDTGEHNNVEIVGHSQKEYYSGNVKKDANNSETTLQGTRSLHVVGTSTFAVDSNSTESVDGNKSEVVTGVTTETYNDTHTTNDINLNENVKGKKVGEYSQLEINVSKKTLVNSVEGYELTGNDVKILTDSPITYSSPKVGTIKSFDYIEMLDTNNNLYKLLVQNNNTEKIDVLLNNKIINVLDYGADNTGNLDSTNAFQNCINTGYSIFIPSGTYIVEKLVLKNNTVLIGENLLTTILKLPSSAENSCVVITENFDELSGTNSHNGVYGFILSNITFVGNEKNNTGAKLYGYNYVLDKLTFEQFKSSGLYTEWSSYAGAPPIGDYMESIINDLRFHNNNDGLIFRGPHDSKMYGVLTYNNTGTGASFETSPNYSGIVHLVNYHSYANKIGTNVSATITGVNLSSESNQQYGWVFNKGSEWLQLLNLDASQNNVSAFKINDLRNSKIIGTAFNCPVVIDLSGEMTYTDLNLKCYSENGKIFAENYTPNITNKIDIYGWGGNNKIYKHDYYKPIIKSYPPTGTGQSNLWYSNSEQTVVCYPVGGKGCHIKNFIDNDFIEINDGAPFILAPYGSAYWTVELPSSINMIPL